MSEISNATAGKPRQFFKPDDFGDNCWMNPIAASDIANERLAPVLQMMKEMGTAIDNLAKGKEIFPQSYADAVLEKYKSFLSNLGENGDSLSLIESEGK